MPRLPRFEALSRPASPAFGRVTLVCLGLAALAIAVAPATLAAGEAPTTAPVPQECRNPNLSAAEQARCDFIARTPDLCLRSGLSEETQRFCDELAEPQAFVVCTGWHALCTNATDCEMRGDKADCDCMRVNETHIVMTEEIQDGRVKHLTQAKCTNERPCGVDQAPVCKAIKYGRYKVDGIRYDWVSTYSYRGWCSLLPRVTACDVSAKGYTGDLNWAICDAAPCTEKENPADPARPLSCQCRVETTPFAGLNESCRGDNGGIMSAMALWAWDFENNTYPFPMPGYEYVQGACAPLESDPFEEPRARFR
jgi:hypothetical protein